MKPNYKLTQPRRVLDSKLLKHISSTNFSDKVSKYYFLTNKYKLF